MDNNTILFLILILSVISAVSQIAFLLLQLLKTDKKTVSEVDKNTDDRALEIIHLAQEKATKILSNAELKGIEFISRQKLDVLRLEDEYKKSIEELEQKLITQFHTSLEAADKSYQGFLGVLQENIRQQEIKNQRVFDEKTKKILENSESAMTSFITEVNSKIGRQIDDQLKAVRNELELYKNRRIEIINKYIIDILERTLEETLGKKLTLEEHSELIFQALEKAKEEQKMK